MIIALTFKYLTAVKSGVEVWWDSDVVCALMTNNRAEIRPIMESLNSIKETIDISLLVFAPISINPYLPVIVFHPAQNNARLSPRVDVCRHLIEYSHKGPSFIHAAKIRGPLIGNQHISQFTVPTCISISLTYHLVTLFRCQYLVCNLILCI